MKLTAFILVLGFLIAGMQGKGQTVTVSVKDVKLESVLKLFKKQTGYSFFVDEPTLGKAARVTLNLQNTPLTEALEKCFAAQPNLGYSIVGNTVVVSEKAAVNNTVSNTVGQQASTVASGYTLTGFVFNKRFEPLANASIMVKGTAKGTTSGSNGGFKLPGGKKDDVLRISFIGYKTAEITVAAPESNITVIMEDATSELDQVVAQGYSKTTRRLSTSSVARVSGEEIGRQPVMNPLMALQSKVPGMVVTPLSGNAAAPIEITIRGKNLLSFASPNPLIVIDGTPLNVSSNQGVRNGDGPVQGLIAMISPAGSQSQLFGINPKDIESIEVLKDLGSTAIYGSSGANGVILITTKRAKAGTSDLNVNVEYGISKVLRYWKLLNTQQYLEMRREAYKNDGLTPAPYDAPDLLSWDSNRYTDWQKEVYGNTGNTMSAMVSYSGGGPQLKARLSANYMGGSPITRVTGKNESIGVSLAVDFSSNNQKFRASSTVLYTYSFADMVNMPNMAKLPPNAPALLDSIGEINFQAYSGTVDVLEISNIKSLFRPIDSRTNGLQSNVNMSYQLAKGLSFISNLGYGRTNNVSWALVPIRSQNPAEFPMGSSYMSQGATNTFTFEPQLSYDTWIGRGKLGVIAGATYKNEKRESLSVMALGYSNDAMLRSISSAPFSTSTNTYDPYKYFGVFGRAEYVWDNKYIFNMLGRRDGSSRFGPGSRFGNFGSVGIAWIASAEPWFKEWFSPIVNQLKIYSNIGTAGSDGGSDYQYLTQWGRGQYVNYGGEAPMVSMHAINQDYHWQSARELNIGIDAGFLKDSRVSLSINYYRKQMRDQLLYNPTPVFTGFPTVYGNWKAVVQNEGYEATVSVNIIQQKTFSWMMTVNGGFNKDKLLSYPGIEKSPDYSNYLVGESVQNKYLLNYVGVDPMTGLYQFMDYNKDGVIDRNSHYSLAPLTYPSDRQRVMSMAPKLTGGMTQFFRYKNVSLNVLVGFKIQNGINAFSNVPAGGNMGNIPLEVFNNRWRMPGDIAKYSRFTTLDNQAYARTESSLVYTDASYLRLNNISFSWAPGEKILRRMGMKGCSIGINAQNLFVITRYEGIDPDIQSFNTMPPAKTIVASFSLTL